MYSKQPEVMYSESGINSLIARCLLCFPNGALFASLTNSTVLDWNVCEATLHFFSTLPEYKVFLLNLLQAKVHGTYLNSIGLMVGRPMF